MSNIIDATDIETTPKCVGYGRKTVEEKHINKKTGEIIKIPKTTYGFKLLVIRGVKRVKRGKLDFSKTILYTNIFIWIK